MDLLELLRRGGMDGDVDFLREALRVLVEGIMDAEVSASTGAGYGERSPERVTQRNGYRSRAWDRGYVNRCVNDIRRRPSQPLAQRRFHPRIECRDRRLRSTQGPSDA